MIVESEDRTYAEALAERAGADRAAAAAEEGAPVVTALGDYPILHAPTISLAAFSSILRNAGSPAASEAGGLYNAAVQYGVDPAVLLAVFQHESGFGKAGVAAKTKGIGNLRYYEGSAPAGSHRVTTAHNGSFVGYSSWTAGALDTSRLLASSTYGKSKNYATVRTFPFKWAPSADHNKPAAYGAALARQIAKWTGNPGAAYKTSSKTSPATHVSSAMTKATKAAPKAVAAAKGATASVGGPGTLIAVGLVAAAFVVLLLVLAASKPRNGGDDGGS